jgi:shikimate dehydrogenase
VVFARRPEVAAELGRLAESVGLNLTVRRWEEVAAATASPLVISTTPADSTGALCAAISGRPGILFDVIYSPWPTPLASDWDRAGGVVIGGLELLVEQAALQVALMTGQPPPAEAMRRAGHTALGGRR